MIKKALSLSAAAAFMFCGAAQAGYSTLATPNGFTGAASASARATYAAAATDKAVQNVIRQAGGATATVAGNKVKIDVAYKLAANAPRIAALVVMQHPAVRLAVTAVGIISWLASAKLVYDIATGTWRETSEATSGDMYSISARQDSPWFSTPEQACAWYSAQFVSGSYPVTSPGNCAVLYKGSGGTIYPQATSGYSIKKGDAQCPSGWTPSSAGCLSPALDQPTFVDKLAGQPMPSTVPLELPYPSPLPIEQPSPWINPTPGENPQSQPYRVPTGQPSPVPNTNPQQYKQPYVDIVPAPTPDNPWRVDIKPGEVTSTDPNPVTNPKPDEQNNPTEEEDKSLCEKHPDIAACEKVEVQDTPLPAQPKLYEPKYPDGLTGVWNKKSEEIKATPLFSLGAQLMPTVGSGSCPSWKVDLSFDGWTNAGLQDVSPPCWVWDVARVIIIVSALLLARRLIFGG